ncbi:MAG: hypothetical protein HY800_08670 [Ignavibacteriales bacterium]|nr:hypothetical protein [Ignavibacteriales bacterium]
MKKPAVPRRWLYLIAGTVWLVAGFFLMERAYEWLNDFNTRQLILILSLGFILALIFYFSGFVKVAQKNVNRINSLPDSVCIFAFTAWKGYLIIAIMITTGIILRNSPFPKHYLAVFYIAMGGPLLIGSYLFYKKFINKIFDKR